VNPIPLSTVERGRKVTIADIAGGFGFAKRLSAMGILPGASVEVVQGSSRGPVVVRVMESKVVLGRGIARRIMVNETE